MLSSHALYESLLIVSIAVLGLGLVSGLVNYRLWISEPLICLAVGIAGGPLGLGWINLDLSEPRGHRVVVEAARITLAVAVVGATIRLPGGYFRKYWREVLVVLGLGMCAMWIVVGGLGMWILNVSFPAALLAAAALAPTDPVLAAPIVTGELAERCVHARLRDTITAESSANDGLALVLVLVSVALLSGATEVRPVSAGAVASLLAWEVIGGGLLGAAIGAVTGRLLRWSVRQKKAEHTSLITVALALSLGTLSAARVLEMDGILAAFAAGAVLNQMLSPPDEAEERQRNFDEAVRRFFDLPFFVVLGAVLPWDRWIDLGYRGIGFALAVMALRRLPVWLLLWRAHALPSVRNLHEAVFAGWFGPVGIAAVFYALEWQGHSAGVALWPIVSLAVFASIVLHGVSGTPLTRLLMNVARRY